MYILYVFDVVVNNNFIIALSEPNALKIEQNNYGCVLTSLGSLAGIVPYTTFYSKEEFINKNKTLLKKFNRALNKGLEFTKNNSSYVLAQTIQNQFTDTSIEDLEKLIDRYKINDSWYDTTYININDYDRLQDILIYNEAIEYKIDSNILITNEFN